MLLDTFFWRFWLMMRADMAGPMPLIASSSAAVAVLTSAANKVEQQSMAPRSSSFLNTVRSFQEKEGEKVRAFAHARAV